jgi:hypothetical protein
MGYVPYGPFVAGSAPGISSSFLNSLEGYLVTVNSAATDASITASAGVINPLGLIVGASLTQLTAHNTVKNGSTSGTMTVSEYFATGSGLKIILINYSNYKNAGSANTVALNAPFVNGGQIFCGFTQGINFVHSGSNQGISVITALGSSGDGGSTTQTSIYSHSIGQVGPFDSIREGGGNSLSRSGQVFVIGF